MISSFADLRRKRLRLAAGLEVVRRNGDEAAVAKIESLLTMVLGLLDEADEARAVSVAPPL